MNRIITLCLGLMLASLSLPAQSRYSHTIQAEKLGRGVVAVKAPSGVFVSWRSLLGDDSRMTFDVFRNGTKLNNTPLKVTNWQDNAGSGGAKYTVKCYVEGNCVETAEATAWSQPYLKVHLDRPNGGVSGSGGAEEMTQYTYTPDDVSVGDVDGDGEWELIVKWFPTNQADNSLRRKTGKTYLDCYKLDGTKLWRIDLGLNIRSGNHYTQFMVYDFDGDGKAEVMCKTAPRTIDGTGKPVLLGDDTTSMDFRIASGNNTGVIKNDGHEYLTVFSGETGAEIHSIYYNPPFGIQADTKAGWGDTYANRSERYLAGVAYLDGKTPSAIFCRGYYTAAYVWAVNFDGKKLTEKWLHKSETPGAGLYGEGAHSLTIGDVDGDGCDEIVYGAAMLDHDGKTVHRTGAGHGDALHLGDFDPEHEGLEVFMVHEDKDAGFKWDSEFRDAATSEILWGTPQSGHDIGRGLTGNITTRYRGYEVWPGSYYNTKSCTMVDGKCADSNIAKVFTAKGDSIPKAKRPSCNFRVYWDGDYLDELFDGSYSSSTGVSNPSVTKPTEDLSKINTLISFSQYSNAASCNTTKATPNLQADLFGDWREEIILHDASTESDLLIFSTTLPTSYKVNTLMQDRQYREAVAWQNTAYNQPPHLSYNLEELILARPVVSIVSGSMDQVVYLDEEITPIEFLVKFATGAESVQLPEGLSLTLDPATLTGKVTGSISTEGEFPISITTTGGNNGENTVISGTIKVRKNTAVMLLARYPFEAVGATTPNFIAGEKASAYNGIAATAVEGKSGNALKLSGTECYVQEGYDMLDFGARPFSIEFWMNSTCGNSYILHKGATSSTQGGNWIGLEYKGGNFKFAVDDDSEKSEASCAASTCFDGQWHHIALVRDVYAKELRIYIDGEKTATGVDKTGAVNCAHQALVIGNANLSFDNPYTGLIDELSIYQGVLTDAKIREHYESATDDYIAYFPMDDIGSTTPNLTYGEAEATAAVGSSEGLLNGAAVFDGNGVFRQTVYDALQVGEKDFSIELWMKSEDTDAYLFCLGTHNLNNVAGGTGNWIGLERKSGYLSFSIDDNVRKTDCKDVSADDVFDGQWHHIVCVRDFAAKTLRLYVDGKERASATSVGTGAIGFSATEIFFIGGDDEINREYTGEIDELMMYSRALSATDIEERYNLLRLTEIGEIEAASSAPARYTVVDAYSGRIIRTAVGTDRDDIIDGIQPGIYILVIEQGDTVRTFKLRK